MKYITILFVLLISACGGGQDEAAPAPFKDLEISCIDMYESYQIGDCSGNKIAIISNNVITKDVGPLSRSELITGETTVENLTVSDIPIRMEFVIDASCGELPEWSSSTFFTVKAGRTDTTGIGMQCNTMPLGPHIATVEVYNNETSELLESAVITFTTIE